MVRHSGVGSAASRPAPRRPARCRPTHSGTIIRLRTSFTITAKDAATGPKATPAASTEEVSLMAVPAHSPNASSDRPSAWPSGG
ncbi:Uncharacterised protein [Mycobacteroides abscessus subsp. abscessus]|nr:Uncharacterised protein [Mycobacteroides abscessus subsp. abscessus]